MSKQTLSSDQADPIYTGITKKLKLRSPVCFLMQYTLMQCIIDYFQTTILNSLHFFNMIHSFSQMLRVAYNLFS